MIIPKEFGNYTAKSKIEYIALNSLSFFIVKAIDEHIGYKFRAVTRCKLVDNKTITEVL